MASGQRAPRPRRGPCYRNVERLLLTGLDGGWRLRLMADQLTSSDRSDDRSSGPCRRPGRL